MAFLQHGNILYACLMGGHRGGQSRPAAYDDDEARMTESCWRRNPIPYMSYNDKNEYRPLGIVFTT